MTRKILITLAIAGTALSAMQASAYSRTVQTKTVSFSAIPCSLLCGYGDLEAGDDYACSDPMVPGSYSDHIIKVPTRANYMIFSATPSVDWDLFLCRAGKVLRYSATRYINVIGHPEMIGTYVRPGTSYRLRAYNNKDTEDLVARVVFRYVRF